MSERERQQQQVLENLMRIKRTTEETKEVATNINLKLYQQGQQLDRINDKTKDINVTLDKSKETAKQIDSYWYYLKSKLKRALGLGQTAKKEGSVGGATEKEEQVQKVEKKEANFSNQEPKSAEDDALDDILQDLEILKKAGKLTGKTLDKQIKNIKEIDRGIDRANNTTTQVNGIMRNILR